MANLRIAAFGGFRTIPPTQGGAGSDKFAFELYPRLVKLGCELTAYCRIYPGEQNEQRSIEYEGVKLFYFRTVSKAGFDTLVHSFKATFHIIFRNTADVVHIHSGANSIWALFLRCAGKRVCVSQFAMDWKRDKWPWYGKLFYRFSNYLTAFLPNQVAFDNIFTKEYFERRFNKRFIYIPYGSEVREPPGDISVLNRLGVTQGNFFLFVGRFIPDKGVHILIKAFENIPTDKKLVLVGGSPNPGSYEEGLRATNDNRVIFAGYVYGDETNILMKSAYAYVQPSLIEGLSPVILTVMGLGTPMICSDIPENKFITGENATLFVSGNTDSLREKLIEALNYETQIKEKAGIGKEEILSRFNWDNVAKKYLELFNCK